MTDTPDVAAGDPVPAGRDPLTVPAFDTLADLERFLRTTGRYSRREAFGIVVEAKALILRKPPADETARAIVDALNRRAELMGGEPKSAEGVR